MQPLADEAITRDTEVATRAFTKPSAHLATGMMAIFTLVAALYLGRGFFIPLLIGIIASYALHPLVDRFQAFRIPRSIGAALVLALLAGSISWVGFSISDDAVALIEKLPDAARNLRKILKIAHVGAPSPLQNMQEAAQELQAVAMDVAVQPTTGEKKASNSDLRSKLAARAVLLQPPNPTWLRDYTLEQSALLVTVAAQAPIVLLLTYFLLASGAHFRRKLVQFVGPSLSRKKDAVRILDEIDTQVQRYLLTMLVSNTLLAITTWLAFLALGLEAAGVWGVAAGVFHFVPYLGPALIAFGSAVAAFLQSGSLAYALAIAGASLVVSGLIGLAFMTWLQSRFARVNAAVLFIALLFFGWLWGVWGLFLGAPLVAIAKVIFDRVESLKALGELLGH